MVSANNVTLCCIDTVHHVLAAGALRRSAALMNFAKVIFITDRREFVDGPWEHHKIKTLDGYEDFNKFMLKGLYFHIETDYVLTVQYDGFVINPGLWTDEFLNYDYIGAPMPHVKKEYSMGNGGFSLRSRKLLKALQDEKIQTPPSSINEDMVICGSFRSYLELNHGITYAPLELADKFSYESGNSFHQTFGFHNLSMLSYFYNGNDATIMTDSFQPYVMKNFQLNALAIRYAFMKKEEEAARLFRRIADHQSREDVRKRLVTHGAQQEMIDIFENSWDRFVINKELLG